MSYLETVQYLDSFINYEKKNRYPYKGSFKLERIRDFLRLLDNPQDSLQCIHIAGTKGKGSVSAFAAYILKEAGYKVGLYTSPHLSEVRERIRILDKKGGGVPERRVSVQSDFEGMITRQALDDLVFRLKPSIDGYNRRSKFGELSFFEVYTALALQYFKEQKTDFVVLETGLGGRLDATNVVRARVCGITSISLDHTQKLGNTLAEIAGEKAGIIKKDSWENQRQPFVVSAPQENEVREIIRERCKRNGARLYEIGQDISFQTVRACLEYQEFNIRGALGDFNNLRTRLLGSHQVINAALGVSLVVLLGTSAELRLDGDDIKRGLYNTVWPGRFQIVSRDPFIILDGAHNPASARVLRENISAYFPGKRIILILGISRDKDIKEICAELIPQCSDLIITRAHNPRSAAPEDIVSYAHTYAGDRNMMRTKNITEALQAARKKAGKDSVIAVAGSLFLVAEVLDLIQGR